MEPFDKLLLKKYAQGYDIVLGEDTLVRFEQYYKTLVEYNEKVNLTAITKPDEVAVKHFIDSLLLTKQVEIIHGAKMIDVGTGAGFPSVPVKLVRDDVDITLLDSLNKRIVFLSTLSEQLAIKTQTIHARAEEAGQKKELREHYDIATARAVAHLRELAEYCLPFVKVGGLFVAMKGFEIEQELLEAQQAIKLLGGKLVEVKKTTLPDESKRSFVIIKKISPTSAGYPRPSAKIAKKSLQ